ncbi:MAG: sigma-70 family RNA polymerase sigma factor [Acidobacteriota bacterium]
MDAPDLSTLTAQCRAGDSLAWETFVRYFQGRIYGLARSYVDDREEAADLAQDIFVRLFEIRDRWAHADDFVPWMFHVARNQAIDFLRRRRVRRPAVAIPAEDVPALADRGESPEAYAIGQSRREQLWQALRRLSALSREILVLRDVHGLSVQETAAVLKVPAGTVKSRSNRARAELAERLLATGAVRGEP